MKLAAFGSEWAARPPFRGVGVDVFDAGTDRLASEESFEMAPCNRKVIEIKGDALRTRRRRLFNHKIDALVTFSTTASPILGNVASFERARPRPRRSLRKRTARYVPGKRH